MEIKPTESELEILQILWQKGSCTVRDVHEELALNKDAGYTTTLKLMQIMAEKGLVERDTTNRTHVYKAAVSQDDAQKHYLDKMINNVFNGSAANLVMQALGNHKSSKAEIEAIKQYLDQLNNPSK
ncbi:transcriptional regulator [Mucilaginibacter sp. PPCGB 2223]|uniref:BlaI/MecI/CopY family transcriptional regulator n=1 Tax=Mucilaginibacter sp. PPCGB 2223 TaxID=1886027 RepID=UPI0008266F74|nr:BlaI/MecI/CopY family transcriptional regulator [Mucilaginibacter sp. PPCGB 2223]OCX50709.1 transcriptional regulator [Mucilaginibacter sp. PPCGB 2223]